MLNDCKGKEHAKEQLAVIRGSQSKKKHTIITMIQSLQKLLYRRSRGKIQSYVKATDRVAVRFHSFSVVGRTSSAIM